MRISAKIILFFVASMLIAGSIFYGFYTGIENIESASTGFNASSQGFFGWDYSFAEHTFEVSGDEFRAVLIESGREILIGPLVAEIFLSLILGFGVPCGGWIMLHAFKNETGEQGVAPNRSTAPLLNSTSSLRGSED